MTDYASIVKESVPMVKAASYYGYEPNRSGFICCPFHGERTPSLKLYRDHYYCFGCHRSGSVIDFTMELFDLPFRDALEKLNMDFGLGLPIGHRPTIRQLRRSQALTRQRRQRADERERADREYQDALREYTRLDRQSRDYAPSRPGEELHPLFVEALENMQAASQRLRDAELAANRYKEDATTNAHV